MVLQSFVRGMYLGGLKGWALKRQSVPLFASGRKYFGDMLIWSIFQTAIGALVVFLAAAFFPFGILLMIAMLFYSLTPYLIVLQDKNVGEAMADAPRLLRRYFGSLFPLALLALFGTLIISLFRSLAPPWGYGVPLLAYACVGTWLIDELLRRLAVKLKGDGGQASLPLAANRVRTRKSANAAIVLLVPLLVAAGMYAASGKHLNVLDFGGKTQLGGIAYNADFSDVFYVSEQRYTAYRWQNGGERIAIKLPDLSGEKKPGELRGIADITWHVDEEVRTVSGHTTQIDVRPIPHKSKVMYRLVRETSNDGTVYYSSMSGSASILLGEERPRDPIAVQMMVSGDGSDVFVMQYPARFEIDPVFRVSENGRYLIPGTSRLNPGDFHAYWFSAAHSTDKLLDLLAAKNIPNYTASLNRAYTVLAGAMQEGDGRMVVSLLEMMRQDGVHVNTPDWDEAAWTANLRSRYEGAPLPEALELLTRAGIQNGYEPAEQATLSDEKIGVYKLAVQFPHGMMNITYKEAKADGKLLAVTVADGMD